MARLQQDDFNTMVKMRERGLGYALIAKEIGCSIGSVAWHCLRLGAEPPKPAPLWKGIVGPAVVVRNGHELRRFTAQDDETLLSMEAGGATLSEMARALGRRHNSIKGRLMTLARRQARQEAA